MNELEQHFDGETPYITLNGETPMANGMPTHVCFLNKK